MCLQSSGLSCLALEQDISRLLRGSFEHTGILPKCPKTLRLNMSLGPKMYPGRHSLHVKYHVVARHAPMHFPATNRSTTHDPRTLKVQQLNAHIVLSHTPPGTAGRPKYPCRLCAHARGDMVATPEAESLLVTRQNLSVGSYCAIDGRTDYLSQIQLLSNRNLLNARPLPIKTMPIAAQHETYSTSWRQPRVTAATVPCILHSGMHAVLHGI